LALALVSACALGGGTHALFSSQASADAVIVAGDFALAPDELAWDSPTQSVAGSGADALASVSLGDGDVLVLDQRVRTHFTGDNLRVALGVDWTGLPEGGAVTWHLADADGRQVAPASGEAALGQQVTPPGIVGDDAGVWHVVATLTMPSGTGVYGDPAAPPMPAATALGTMTITANQVRG